MPSLDPEAIAARAVQMFNLDGPELVENSHRKAAAKKLLEELQAPAASPNKPPRLLSRFVYDVPEGELTVDVYLREKELPNG